TYQALEKYDHDLVADAEDGKLNQVIGRDQEIRHCIQVLSRRMRNNPVLIEETSVGKTSIVEELAQSDESCRGKLEERLKSVLKETENLNGGIILFIDELHLVLGARRAEGAMNVANLLNPMLARDEVRCIGTTKLDEYRKYIEKYPTFESCFQQVLVKELTVAARGSILRGLKDRYGPHFGVRILHSALVIDAELSNRYIANQFLPHKAINLIDETCTISQWTGTLVSKLSQTESEHLHEKLIEQDDAVNNVAEVFLRSRAGLSKQNQPIGLFLFSGPTGVGETKSAKTLALELFD
ncbi:unnamed protein product, partial [Rotaria sp. Silwood1]